jgi:hypothetical protein
LPVFFVPIWTVSFPGDGLEEPSSEKDGHFWLWGMVKEGMYVIKS